MGDVAATVINVISAKRDAEMLKKLLSFAVELPENPNWLFISTGLHLIVSTTFVESALRAQFNYCT